VSADDILGTLEARAPRRLLEDLSVIARAHAANDRQRPEIEVQLTSGAQIRGRIVSVTEDRAGAVAMLYVGGQPRSPSVSFVRVDQIAAVTVIDASLLVRTPISDAPAPSGLELKRLVAAHSDSLAAMFGCATPLVIAGELDEDDRRALGVVLPVLVDVLRAVGSDEMGKTALSTIESVEISAWTHADVTKVGAKLVVHAPKLLTDAFTVASLRAAIEKVL
jgi:hypothetical protein